MLIQEASKSPDLTDLERMVLETACAATGVGATYAPQITAAKVSVRTPSGVGVVTKIEVPGELGLQAPATSLPVVIGDHPALPSGAEFILQVKDGRINSIEAFCYEGMWPQDESLFKLRVD